MTDQRDRIGDCLPPGIPKDGKSAQVLVLAVLVSIHPKGMSIFDLACELSNEGEDWVERAVRDLAVADLVRCEGGEAFATFSFSDLPRPKQSGSQ